MPAPPRASRHPQTIRLVAPAKLNLYLRVLGKRPDGYHELETLFERIDLADELTFERHPHDLRLTCDAPELSCGEDNLIVRAARLLQHEYGTAPGAEIHLVKRIPIAAGLGGGSSDAAATLRGLNRLWDLKIQRPRLMALAAQLGSDVPFFLHDAAFAAGRGRGERCEPIHAARRLAHVLVVPDVRLSTKEIYEGARFDLTAPKPSFSIIVHALCNGSLSELAKGLWNDLEPQAIRRCPLIADIQAHLRQLGCLEAHVSGSGSSTFGLCRDAEHAQDVAGRLRQRATPSWRIEVVQTNP